MKLKYAIVISALIWSGCTGCGEDDPEIIDDTDHTQETWEPVSVPTFNADSAYQFIADQVNFGPRYPGTVNMPVPAHDSCAAYLKNKLLQYGFEVTVQKGEVVAYNNARLQIQNIIGQYKPEAATRILLFAHWDSRHLADKEQDPNLYKRPILGADDGGSGVGVLLEIARLIQTEGPEVGVDIIFFDAEDYGQPSTDMVQGDKQDTYCLGTQFWARSAEWADYSAKYGILLDMVGARNAVFPKEGTSMQYAPSVVNKVWKIARNLGHTQYFLNQQSYSTIDDHLYVNRIAHVPSIDIVNFNPTTNNYGAHHHTHSDNMDVIDKGTLQAVGETLMQVIYAEK